MANTDPRYLRHQKHLPEKVRALGLNFIGAGSVGSHMIMMFARMGFENIKVYDPDTVEDQNLGNQDYPNDAVGKLKVDALKEELKRRTAVTLQGVPEKFPCMDMPIPGVIISSVDTMQSRRDIWTKIKKNPNTELYIDTRMGLIQGNVYWINPHNRKVCEWYENQHLVGDGVEDPCEARTVAYTVYGIACMVGSDITRYVLKGKTPAPLRILDASNLEVEHVLPREG